MAGVKVTQMFDHGKGIRNPLFFVGVIEENNDPRLEGRVKVRAFGIHGTISDIATDELPWAICVKGDYDPNGVPGLGLPALNSFVFGTFLDGDSAQQPMVLGLIPTQMTEIVDPIANGWGVIALSNAELLARGSNPSDFGQPQNSRRSRGEYLDETSLTSQNAARVEGIEIAGRPDRAWSEPPPAGAPQYPFNRVFESGSHTIELDDTPDNERITIYHKAGSYIQIDHRGVVVNKAVSDQYDVLDRNEHKVVGAAGGGFSTVTINGNSYVKVNGNKIEEITGDLETLVHGNHLHSVGNQYTMVAGIQAQIRAADVKIEANVSSLIFKAGKEVQFEAGQGIYVKSDKVYIQAMEELHLKADLTYLEGTSKLEIFGAQVFANGTDAFDIKGDTELRLGSGGSIHVQTPGTINMDTMINMANGDAASADGANPAEGSKSATAIEAPEPVTQSTSIHPAEDRYSVGGGGVTSRDDGNDNTDDSATQTTVSTATQSSVAPLLDFIASVESASSGHYEAVSGQIPSNLRPSRPITTMTIGEILDYQESVDAASGSEPLGRYQIVEDTLRGFDNNDPDSNKSTPLYQIAGLSKSDLFNPSNQDKMAMSLLERRGLNSYLAGTMTIYTFGNNLAKEWAGLPLVDGEAVGKTTGESYYQGDGLNSAPENKVNAFLNVLRGITSSNTALNTGGAR